MTDKKNADEQWSKDDSMVKYFVYPFEAFCRLRYFQFALLVLSVYPLYRAVSCAVVLQDYGMVTARTFRIEVLSKTAVNGSVSLQLIKDGCNLSTSLSSSIRADVTPVLTFPSALILNGFKLKIVPNASAEQTAGFIISGSLDNMTWGTVGSSVIRRTANGVRYLSHPVALTGQIFSDYRAPWPLICGGLIDPVLQALGLLATGVSAAVQRQDLAQSFALAAWLLLTLNAAVAGIGYSAMGLGSESFCPLVYSLCYLLLGLSQSLAELYLADSVTAAGIAALAATVGSAAIQICPPPQSRKASRAVGPSFAR